MQKFANPAVFLKWSAMMLPFLWPITALVFAVLMGNLVLFQTCWPLAGAAAPPPPAPPAPVAAPVLKDISPPASPHVLLPVLAVAALAAAVPDSLDNSVVSDVIDALFSD